MAWLNRLGFGLVAHFKHGHVFHCFTVHFNSLNFTHQLMHFYIQ